MEPYQATHESTIGCCARRKATSTRLKAPTKSSGSARARPSRSRAASFGNRIAPGLSGVGSLIISLPCRSWSTWRSPTQRSRLALERAGDARRDPATIEVARLGVDLLSIQKTCVHQTGVDSHV